MSSLMMAFTRGVPYSGISVSKLSRSPYLDSLLSENILSWAIGTL